MLTAELSPVVNTFPNRLPISSVAAFVPGMMEIAEPTILLMFDATLWEAGVAFGGIDGVEKLPCIDKLEERSDEFSDPAVEGPRMLRKVRLAEVESIMQKWTIDVNASSS